MYRDFSRLDEFHHHCRKHTRGWLIFTYRMPCPILMRQCSQPPPSLSLRFHCFLVHSIAAACYMHTHTYIYVYVSCKRHGTAIMVGHCHLTIQPFDRPISWYQRQTVRLLKRCVFWRVCAMGASGEVEAHRLEESCHLRAKLSHLRCRRIDGWIEAALGDHDHYIDCAAKRDM